MDDSKDRVRWLTALRAVAMPFVVVGHVLVQPVANAPHAADALRAFIYAWHMPLFLACSGIAYELSRARAGDWTRFAKRRAIRLLVPYAIAGAFLVFPAHYFFGVDPGRIGALPDILLLKDVSHIWYLWALFSCSCLTYAMDALHRSGAWRFALSLVLAAACSLVYKYHLPVPPLVVFLIRNCAFFEFGRLMLRLPRRALVVAVPICAASVAYGLQGRALRPGILYFAAMSTGMSVSVVAMFAARRFLDGKSGFLEFLDRRGMCLYLIHEPIFFVLARSDLPRVPYPLFLLLCVVLAYAVAILLHGLLSRTRQLWIVGG